jgi:2-oxoglutarate dehydrogenase complex dehydrogenase (E1) component-like enzyme
MDSGIVDIYCQITNPIRKNEEDRQPHLDIKDYGLTEGDLDKTYEAAKELGIPGGTLRQIIGRTSNHFIVVISVLNITISIIKKRGCGSGKGSNTGSAGRFWF